jgi:capsular polysaccharide transport system permease protein
MSNIDQESLNRSFATQCRVVKALLFREILTRYGRHNIGFLWLFFEPMLFTLGITALWTFTKSSHGSTLPIIPFAVIGYSSVLVWRNSANRVSKAIEPNLSLLYHRNVKVIDLFAARLILEIMGASISFILLSLFFMATDLMSTPVDIFMMMQAWALLTWFAISLALVIGAISERSELFDRFWHTITYLLFPFSGAVFMVNWLPKAAQDFVLWLPMVHGVEMLRHGYFGPLVKTYENPMYVALVNSILMLIGLAMVKEAGRRVEPE